MLRGALRVAAMCMKISVIIRKSRFILPNEFDEPDRNGMP